MFRTTWNLVSAAVQFWLDDYAPSMGAAFAYYTMELKLNEIVAAVAGASNRLIDVESLTSAELIVLRRHYRELADMAQEESSVTKSHFGKFSE